MTTTATNHLILSACLLSALSTQVTGFLLSGPVDTNASAGDTVELICRSNLTTTVKWILGHPASTNVRSIFVPTSDGKGTIHPDFTDRFSCVRQQDGFQNLVIKIANLSDTGIYTCIDDEGFGFIPGRSNYGRWGTATLVVIDRPVSSTQSILQYTESVTNLVPHIDVTDGHSSGEETSTSYVVIIVVIISVIVVLLVVGVLVYLCKFRKGISKTKKRELSSKDQSELTPMKLNAEFVTTGEQRNGLDAKLFLNKPKVLGVIPVDKAICGVTVLNNELFIARCGSPEMKVYNTDNYQHSRDITITGLLGIWALIASPQCNCLYASDILQHKMYRYTYNPSNITEWFTYEWTVGGQCEGLSITSEYNILATLWDEGIIEEYTSDGGLIRKISLDDSINDPQHTIQLSNGQLLITHGWIGSSLYRVCIIDITGSIIQSYGESGGCCNVGPLNLPRHLAVDACNNILVADCLNNRVVLLSPSLTKLGYITVPGHELKSARVLHLDLLNHRLYIGEDRPTGHVFVLNVGKERTMQCGIC